MASPLDLHGRVAVVLGATSGLGQSIAEGLADHGATVIASGRRSHCYAADVTSRASLEALRDKVLAQHAHVDILINAAGITFRQPTATVTESQWDHLFDVSLTGALRACQAFYHPLRSTGRGRIVNIVSLSSYLAFYEVAAYCAAKTALLSLTRSLAVEWAQDNISVNAIAPGVFPTELNRKLIEGTPRGTELLQRTPMKRFGRPEELTGAAILLSSDAASYLTGQCITIDGGFLAAGVNS